METLISLYRFSLLLTTATVIHTVLALLAAGMEPLMITTGESHLPVVIARVAITANVPLFLSVGITMTGMAIFGVLHRVPGLMTIPLPVGCMRILMMRVLRLLHAMMIRTCRQGVTGVRELLQGVNMLLMIAVLSGRCSIAALKITGGYPRAHHWPFFFFCVLLFFPSAVLERVISGTPTRTGCSNGLHAPCHECT
jgi:hypothetical protein